MMSVDISERERGSMLSGLESSDDELRRLAVERLLELPVLEAIPYLIARLGDSSWRVRKASVERLVVCGEPGAVTDALISAFSDGDNPGRRNSAVEALVAMGPRVVPQLVESLQSHDVDVRKLIVDTIAGIGDPRGQAAMIEALNDPDPNVSAAAADALGSIGGAGAESALRTCAIDESSDQLLRLSSLRSLADLEATLVVSDLRDVLDNPILSPAGYALLGSLDDGEAAACLLKGLESRSRASRDSAMEALLRVLSRRDGADFDLLTSQIREAVRSLPDLLAGVVERLPVCDLSTRLNMVQFLGLVGEPSCVIAILEAGRDEAIAEVAFATLVQMGEISEVAIDRDWERLDTPLRRDACRLLGATGGPLAVERLLESLDAADGEQRSAAAEALAACGCKEALTPLVRRLELTANDDEIETEEECGVLVDALVALCAQPEDSQSESLADVVALVSRSLEDPNERIRLQSARVLGRIGRIEDTDLVTALMKDSSAAVRRAAVEALSRISAGRRCEPLRLAMADESYLVRIAAAEALVASVRENIRDDLERLVRDEDWRVRSATLRAIGAHDCAGLTREDRLSLIEVGFEDTGAVCLAAIEALAQVGGAAATRGACSLLTHSEPELVQAAVDCLGTHADQEDLLNLIPLVSHPNWAVRADAIAVLADRRVERALPSILRRLESEQDDFVRNVILIGLKRLEA
jgi:HEAT repeat protein